MATGPIIPFSRPQPGGMVPPPNVNFLTGGQANSGQQVPLGAQPFMQQPAPQMSASGTPPTGLIGFESALNRGQSMASGALQSALGGSLGDIGGAEGRAQQFLQGAAGRFDPFISQGTGASGIQAALAGAMGPEAQAQALQNLQPVNSFLQEQGDRAVTRNAAALGGLGGGNVLKELTRFGQGLAGQSAQQQFQNLGTIAERGFGGAQNVASLAGQQANTAQRAAEAQSQARLGTASQLGNLFSQTGSQIGGARMGAGQQIASAIGGTTSALADLVNQQGSGLSGIAGAATGNLANLLSGTGAGLSGQQMDLAQLLANISMGSVASPQQSGASFAAQPPNSQAIGGIMQMVGSMFSDERLKENVTRVGQLDSGLGLYTWDWVEGAEGLVGDQAQFGVMAGEVEAIYPDAVSLDPSGYKKVDYSRIS